MNSQEAERYELGEGWTLHATGRVLEHDLFDGGHTSSSVGFVARPGTSEAALRAAADETRAELAASAEGPVASWFELRRGLDRVVLHDEIETPIDGVLCIHLPAVVGPSGVLIRRSVSKDRLGPLGGYAGTDTTMLHPWLVTPDHAVRVLPFEMAVAPLCVLPDGRYLLPGADPLWRDSYAEPLSAVSDDGTVEPLLLGEEPLTPPRIVNAVVPDWTPTPEEGETEEDFLHEFPWWAQRARVDAATGELRVLFVSDDLDDHIDPLRWFVVAVPLNGRGDLRLVGRGAKPAGEPLEAQL